MNSALPALKPYTSYKPTDVEWLGEVPEHWDIVPSRALFNEIKDCGYSEEEMLSVTIRRGVIPQSSLLKDTSKKDASNLDKSKYKLVQPGDIAYNKMRAWQGAIGASDFKGIISPAYIVQRPRGGANPKYYHQLFRIPSFAKEAERKSYGIASDMWSLRPEDFKLIRVCFPPKSEQLSIVHYLDYMDQRIQRYIKVKQKLIKLLKEQKQVTIHHAVTRGLDPDAPLKDSGVEWLGKVPGHWEHVAVKRRYSIQLGKMLQNRQNGPNDTEVPYLKSKHVQWFSVYSSDAPKMWASNRDIDQFGIRPGDLLVCEGGEGGRCGLVGEVMPNCIIQNALHRVRPLGGCRNDYLKYVMSAISSIGWFDAINNKATIAHFTGEKFGALIIPLPSFSEQTAIVKHLDEATAKLDTAITRARREIELLNEYRARLVADVVTGKLDVREAIMAPPKPKFLAKEK